MTSPQLDALVIIGRMRDLADDLETAADRISTSFVGTPLDEGGALTQPDATALAAGMRNSARYIRETLNGTYIPDGHRP